MSQENPSLQPDLKDDEIDLMDYLRVIHRHRGMIVVLMVIAMGVTVVVSLVKPCMYQANTSIVPPTESLSKSSGLASQLGGMGSSLLQGMFSEGNLSELYVGILESRAVSDALIDRFDLVRAYKRARTRGEAMQRLKTMTQIKASDEGIVHITVKDRDPNRAAALANAYVAELDKQNKRLSGGQATSKRQFLENRLNEIQVELQKIDQLQTHEVQIKETLFEMLTKECELAKIEEAKNIPTIQVLDPAVVPERPVARGIAQKGIMAGIVAAMLGIFIAFVREYVQNAKRTT